MTEIIEYGMSILHCLIKVGDTAGTPLRKVLTIIIVQSLSFENEHTKNINILIKEFERVFIPLKRV